MGRGEAPAALHPVPRYAGLRASPCRRSRMSPPSRSVVVFDLGGVLIDWNPRHLYRKLLAGDEAAMEAFLATVCTQAWNERQDGGRSFAEATALLKADHPGKEALIDAYFA